MKKLPFLILIFLLFFLCACNTQPSYEEGYDEGYFVGYDEGYYYGYEDGVSDGKVYGFEDGVEYSIKEVSSIIDYELHDISSYIYNKYGIYPDSAVNRLEDAEYLSDNEYYSALYAVDEYISKVETLLNELEELNIC
jgi:hypothetical protein